MTALAAGRTYGFGARDGQIFQFAWTVADLEASIAQWIRDTGTGPWFVLDHMSGIDPQYRGGPSQAGWRLAMSFANGVNIELIQPLDDHPSVYRETIEKKGYGFHHIGVLYPDVDQAIADHQARGFDLAFKGGVVTGGNVAYLDAADVPGPLGADFIELIPGGEATDQAFTAMWQATRDWDGSDPVRRFPGT